MTLTENCKCGNVETTNVPSSTHPDYEVAGECLDCIAARERKALAEDWMQR